MRSAWWQGFCPHNATQAGCNSHQLSRIIGVLGGSKGQQCQQGNSDGSLPHHAWELFLRIKQVHEAVVSGLGWQRKRV